MKERQGAAGSDVQLPMDPDVERLPIDPDVLDKSPDRLSSNANRHRSERSILLVVGGAGAVGALARYAVGRLITNPIGRFPWSTFWTNVSGSLAIGIVLVLLLERFPRARLARPLIATGFLGAYTTFSTYAVDTDSLFRIHDIMTGVIYALSSLVGGLFAVFIGVVLTRLVIRPRQHRVRRANL